MFCVWLRKRSNLVRFFGKHVISNEPGLSMYSIFSILLCWKFSQVTFKSVLTSSNVLKLGGINSSGAWTRYIYKVVMFGKHFVSSRRFLLCSIKLLTLFCWKFSQFSLNSLSSRSKSRSRFVGMNSSGVSLWRIDKLVMFVWTISIWLVKPLISKVCKKLGINEAFKVADSRREYKWVSLLRPISFQRPFPRLE